MADIFQKLLNMSISASWVVLAVVLIRLLLKKAPKRISVLLWAIVGLRLVLPFSFKSVISLIPSGETFKPGIRPYSAPTVDSGFYTVDQIANEVIAKNYPNIPAASADPWQVFIGIASYIWLFGIAVMLIYMFVSRLRMNRYAKGAEMLEKNVYVGKNVSSPYVIGMLFPVIYLPSGLSEKELGFIIAHEKAHIKRRDNIIKPLGFILLSVYWFNPVLWLAYILLCRDIELACDEKIISDLEPEERADYSETLLLCGAKQLRVSACPVAFGESGVKGRVKSILDYKRPTFWIIAVSVLLCTAAAICLITDPAIKKYSDIDKTGYIGEASVKLKDAFGDRHNAYILLQLDIPQNVCEKYGMKHNEIKISNIILNSDIGMGSYSYHCIDPETQTWVICLTGEKRIPGKQARIEIINLYDLSDGDISCKITGTCTFDFKFDYKCGGKLISEKLPEYGISKIECFDKAVVISAFDEDLAPELENVYLEFASGEKKRPLINSSNNKKCYFSGAVLIFDEETNCEDAVSVVIGDISVKDGCASAGNASDNTAINPQNCRHGEISSFHDIPFELMEYVGSDKYNEWLHNSCTESCPDADLGGSYDVSSGLNIYSFVHYFGIPEEVFALAAKYRMNYYVYDCPTELIYADDPKAVDGYYVKHKNFGENDAEYRKNHYDLQFEKEFISRLFSFKNTDGADPVSDKLAKASKLNKTGCKYLDPDYTSVFSIPEIIKINGIDKKNVKRLYHLAKSQYKDIVSDYDLDYIFDLIEGKAELDEKFAKAGVMDTDCGEVTFEMLDANREFNAYLRSR